MAFRPLAGGKIRRTTRSVPVPVPAPVLVPAQPLRP
jgi:hypothetical protein